MSFLFKLLIVVVLVVLFGSLVFQVLGTAFDWLGWLFQRIADIIDFFGIKGALL